MVDLVAILSVAISGMVSIISTIQNSRCDTINCCGITCHRKLKKDDIGGVSPHVGETEQFVAQPVCQQSS